MAIKPLDANKLDEYVRQAKDSWGQTAQWKEYEDKWAGRSGEDAVATGERLMSLFVPFGQMSAKGLDPSCQEAQDQVATVQAFIAANYYTCTNETLAGLGKAYAAGGDFTRNIDEAAGPGAAAFASAAIEAYCARA